MKVQVNLSDEMVSRVDVVAKNIGMSRSAICAYFIGQGISQIENSYKIVENCGNLLIQGYLDSDDLKEELKSND